MPDPAQEELEAILNQQGQDQLNALMAWHQRHQPPRLSREQVQEIVLTQTGKWKYTIPFPVKELIDALCALSFPPRPTVTKQAAVDMLGEIYAKHNRLVGNESASFWDALVEALCTGAEEEAGATPEPRWCEHWRPEIWCGRPAFARRTGTNTDIIYRESPVRFCDRCGTPRPEGR